MIWERFAYLWAERKLKPPRWASTQPAPSDAMQMGENARRLLDDPVLHLALDRIQAKLADRWRNTMIGEARQREEIYQLHCAVEEFRSELRQMVGNARGIEARARMNERDAA